MDLASFLDQVSSPGGLSKDMCMRFISRLTIIVLLAVSLTWTGITLFLPGYLQQSLLPENARRAGLKEFRVYPVHIDRHGLATGFEIGPAAAPVVLVSSITAHYTLAGLLQRTIKELTFSGVELRCALSGNKLVLADDSLQQIIEGRKSGGEDSEVITRPNFIVERILVRQATVICQGKDQIYRLPMAAEIMVEQQDHEDIRAELILHLSGLQSSSPGLDPAAVPALDLTSTIHVAGSATAELTGNISLPHSRLPTGLFMANLANQDGTPFTLKFAGRYEAGPGTWSFVVNSSPHQVDLRREDQAVQLSSSGFRLLISGDRGGAVAEFSYDAAAEIRQADNIVTIPALKSAASASFKKGETPAVQGELSTTDMAFANDLQGIKAENGQAHLFWRWPDDEGMLQGEFAIKRISGRNILLGSLCGSLEQKKTNISVNSEFNSAQVPGLKIFSRLESVTDNGGLASTSLHFELPSYTFTDFRLADLDSAASGVFSGTMEGRVDMEFGPKGLAGGGAFSLTDGRFSRPDREIEISGIKTAIVLPNLPALRSGPSQEITVSALRMKDLRISGGKVIFTVESPDSLLVEQGSCQWADGTIRTSAFRYADHRLPDDFTLYCHNLKLAKILAQTGMEKVSGEGTVNGQIPVTYKDGKFTFAESFLYSTPGEDGTIRIAEGEYLNQAIPLAAPQFVQLDFTREALRDFNYGWAKLHLVSEDDLVALQLQLDGKPARPLPFSYDGATGNFQRLQDPTLPGIFHPIRLDVNFRFPLNTILGYDEGIRKLFQSIH